MEPPKRKSTRLNGYDDSQNGAYFVTVCVSNPKASLWQNDVGADIIRPGEQPILSKYGNIVEHSLHAIPEHYPHIHLDKYCIMPDHLHMIVFMGESGRMISAPTLSTVIGQMKRWVSKQIGDSIWQKSFNDRIIRNEKEYRAIWQYIDENQFKWMEKIKRTDDIRPYGVVR